MQAPVVKPTYPVPMTAIFSDTDVRLSPEGVRPQEMDSFGAGLLNLDFSWISVIGANSLVSLCPKKRTAESEKMIKTKTNQLFIIGGCHTSLLPKNFHVPLAPTV